MHILVIFAKGVVYMFRGGNFDYGIWHHFFCKPLRCQIFPKCCHQCQRGRLLLFWWCLSCDCHWWTHTYFMYELFSTGNMCWVVHTGIRCHYMYSLFCRRLSVFCRWSLLVKAVWIPQAVWGPQVERGPLATINLFDRNIMLQFSSLHLLIGILC